MTKAVVGVIALLALAGVVGGCGAGNAEAPPPAAPAVAPSVAEPSADKAAAESIVATPSVAGAPQPPPPPAMAVAPAAPGTGRGGSASREMGYARSDLASAEKQLQSAAGDCATACRALGSMERATAHLCALATTGDDPGSCQEARTKVLSGRDRVRASCGDCPGGPSLDRGAPIPSSR